MKIFVAGGMGFVGGNVSKTLESQGHSVYRSTRSVNSGDPSLRAVDLLDREQVGSVMREVSPDVVINCAGVVSGDADDFENNVHISRNLIESFATIAAAGHDLHRFIMCGSAGEYGIVEKDAWPVSETEALNATLPYPSSKLREERLARELTAHNGIDFIVARIFNPVGNNMPAKFLISNVIKQTEEIRANQRDAVSVGRLDALRDYIDIKDVSKAIALLATKDHRHDTYNIGSGIATSTEQIVRCIMEETGLPPNSRIDEVSAEPENPVASQADITRLVDEFGWMPETPLRQTIKGVIHGK